eukprot:scaffold1090_cov265-Pinguiococcus_pyrenoidosus.AAC.5
MAQRKRGVAAGGISHEQDSSGLKTGAEPVVGRIGLRDLQRIASDVAQRVIQAKNGCAATVSTPHPPPKRAQPEQLLQRMADVVAAAVNVEHHVPLVASRAFVQSCRLARGRQATRDQHALEAQTPHGRHHVAHAPPAMAQQGQQASLQVRDAAQETVEQLGAQRTLEELWWRHKSIQIHRIEAEREALNQKVQRKPQRSPTPLTSSTCSPLHNRDTTLLSTQAAAATRGAIGGASVPPEAVASRAL